MAKNSHFNQEFELEKLKLQIEVQRQEGEHEVRLEKIRLEREDKERLERETERQVELDKLKLQQYNHPSGQSFYVIKNFHPVPSFQEDDVDMFFLRIKKLATNLNWPKDYWTILLQKAFVRKT